MTFYFRAEDVPELAGLSRWERRLLLHGGFIKERMISTAVLLVLALGGAWGVINPLLPRLFPSMGPDSLGYGMIVLAWLLFLIVGRNLVMMNLLRPKIAAYRAALLAKQAEKQADTV